MRIETIHTSRLSLRGFTRDDARFAISIWNDPLMGEYLPDAAMEEIDPAYLAQIEMLGEDEECCYLIAESNKMGERIGTCSFIPMEDGAVYDIAYCVHRSYWRQGFATEMAQGMIGHARAQGAKKITVRVNKENAASNRVMQKLGFAVTGEHSYKKRGTDLEFTDYLYELAL